MRVRIITIGSQGDVRPYVALGIGLKKAGHDVRIATHSGFKSLVTEHGLDFAPVAGDPREQADNPQLRELHDKGRSLFQWWKTFNEVDAPLMVQRLQDCWEACSDAEVIVVSVLPCLFGYSIAKKLNVPLIRGFYFPTSPTRAYAADFVPSSIHLNERMNLASFHLYRQVLWQVARPWIGKACRKVLGINSLPIRDPFSELDRQQQLLLYCYSASVSPPPPDWGDWIDVTGYWFLDRSEDWTPPADLTAFLESGPPPVYVGGFGHMTNRAPAELTSAVVEALKSAGVRAVVLSGWGGLSKAELPRDMFAVDWVPFDWLFSKIDAVIHHGGSGTTAASLRAGLPTVVVPFFLDQFYWGRRVHELGVGPRPILRESLEAKTLADAIHLATTSTEMQQRASALGKRIRAENGVARAVSTFQRHLRATA